MNNFRINVAVDGEEAVRTYRITVDNDMSLGDLKVVIEQRTLIPKEYVFIKEEHLLGRTISDISTNNVMLRVEHLFLRNWHVISQKFNTIHNMPGALQSDIALEIIDTIKVLKEAKFFWCYPSLGMVQYEMMPHLLEYLSGNLQTIQESAKQFFFKLKSKTIRNPTTFRVKFHSRPGGYHVGCLCVVSSDNLDDTFYVKSHHMGPNKSNSKAIGIPDLRELFCYVLIEKIGMGPESHFFTSIPGTSKTTVYIATKAIPELVLMEDLTVTTTNIKETVIHIHLLCFLLCLGDVHGRNCGQNGNKNATLFNFWVPPRSDYKESVDDFFERKPQCVDTLVNVRKVGEISEMAQKITSMERREIALKALEGWNLKSVIPSVVERVNEEKKMIRSHSCLIEGTCDFDKYLEGVKYNVSLFLDK